MVKKTSGAGTDQRRGRVIRKEFEKDLAWTVDFMINVVENSELTNATSPHFNPSGGFQLPLGHKKAFAGSGSIHLTKHPSGTPARLVP